MQCAPCLAGAWTLPQGDAQAIVTTAYSFAEDAFDGGGNTVDADRFEKIESRGFFEYGLLDWATVTVQPEWRRKSVESGARSSGFGGIGAGLRVRFWSGGSGVASVQGLVRAPGASGSAMPLDGGDTDWEMDARVLYGRGFPVAGRHAFVNAEAGFRRRFGDPADELRFDLTTGIDITPALLGLVQSFNTVSVGAAGDDAVELREHKVSLSAVYRVEETWAIQAGVAATVLGRNTLQERGGFIALWRSF